MWKKGQSGNPKGMPKGTPRKTTKTLREAILVAAEKVGRDGTGKDGLIGYVQQVAETDPKTFCSLLGKVLPLQVTGEAGGAIEIRWARRQDD